MKNIYVVIYVVIMEYNHNRYNKVIGARSTEISAKQLITEHQKQDSAEASDSYSIHSLTIDAPIRVAAVYAATIWFKSGKIVMVSKKPFMRLDDYDNNIDSCFDENGKQLCFTDGLTVFSEKSADDACQIAVAKREEYLKRMAENSGDDEP